MKKLIWLLTICIMAIVPLASAQDTENKAEDAFIYKMADTQPEYPGGNTEFSKYLYSKLDFTEIEGNIMLMSTFVVEKDGSLSNVKFMSRGQTPAGLAKIMRESPKWKPATIKGAAVRYKYTLPLHFVKN